MSRNDIFSTSFRIQPPPNPPPLSNIHHSHSTSLPDQVLSPASTLNNLGVSGAGNGEGSGLARARTTGQSWLRTRALRRDVPPPLDLNNGTSSNTTSGLQRNRSVHIADKPYVYLLPDLPSLASPSPSTERDRERMSIDTLAPELQTPLVSTSTLLPSTSQEAGPSRTSSFFDLPSARIDPPPPPPPPLPTTPAFHALGAAGVGGGRALTSSSSDFSSAYSTRSNPSLMEELPWDRPLHSVGHATSGGGVTEGDSLNGTEDEEVELRLREERRYFLGEGRFAKVWVGAYRRIHRPHHHSHQHPHQHPPSDEDEDPEITPEASHPSPSARRSKGKGKWHLCAAKQPLPDAESQLLGRREAFFLRHLRRPSLACNAQEQDRFREGRKYVVRLLGVVRGPSTATAATGETGVGRTIHSVPPPLPIHLPQPDGDAFRSAPHQHQQGSQQRPALIRHASSNVTASSPSSATTPLAQQNPDPFRLAPPTPQSLRHSRSVSDAYSASLAQQQQQSSLLSPTPHALRPARSRAASPVRQWLERLPPSPPSPNGTSSPDQPGQPAPLTLSPLSPSQSHQPPSEHSSSPPPPITLLLPYHPLGSLAHLLHTRPHVLDARVYLKLAWEVAMGLAWVHACSVLHTDLKLQNVLLSVRRTRSYATTSTGTAPGTSGAGAGAAESRGPEGEGRLEYSARLADFGSALLLPPAAPSPPTDGLGLGTPGYTAPELLLPPGSAPFTYSADIFSLGVLLGVLLFGREPYEGLVGRGRGRGRMEMMRWARGGGYWAYEEGVRLALLGEEGAQGASVVQREREEEEEGVRRLGKEDVRDLLRDDGAHLAADEGVDSLGRSKTEVDMDVGMDMDLEEDEEETPSTLLEPEPTFTTAPTPMAGLHAVPKIKFPTPLPSPPNSPPRLSPSAPSPSTASSAAAAAVPPAPNISTSTSITSGATVGGGAPTPPPPSPNTPYADGTPAIHFLGPHPLTGSKERAPEELVGLIRGMCSPKPGERPGIGDVVGVLGGLRGRYGAAQGYA